MLQFIVEDIIDAAQYLPIGAGIGLVVCIMMYSYNHLTGRKNGSYLSMFLLSVYVVVLSYLVFFNREPGSRDEVTLELFGTVGNGLRGDSYVLENVFVFVPFGFLLPLVWKRMQSFGWCVSFGCLCSVGIEVLQYVTKRGYSQLDDVVMNTLGTLLGWVLWRMICKPKAGISRNGSKM